MAAPANIRAMKISIDGKVQGVGFRPFVYRLARELSLNGWVRNRNDGVLIHAEGSPDYLDCFLDLLPSRAPEISIISRLESRPVPAGNYRNFTIRPSKYLSGSITGISPDIGVCDKCLSDIERQHHRIGYPLVNCTFCGPRFTIIDRLPYDRSNTSMKEFMMCETCRREYHDPFNRRFHAQPVACNSCGPVYKMEIKGFPYAPFPEGEKIPGVPAAYEEITETAEIIEKLCSILGSGGVVVIKGTGGYNIICDASDDSAVQKVRAIKGRENKPFAVMFRNMKIAEAHCIVTEQEREALGSWRKPVVLLGKDPSLYNSDDRSAAPVAPVSTCVGGSLDTIGAILPYMPFHHLLFAGLKIDALVFTSANITGMPVIADDGEARKAFLPAAGALVSYNRKIINPADDSVCRVTAGHNMIIRRARGYVPDSVTLPFETEGVFAAGADMKNAFAIGRDSSAILSQHIGDLDSYGVFRRYRQNIERFISMFSFSPRQVACDMHPEYQSTRHAIDLAAQTGSRLVRVQHHHAHIASCMAENNLGGPVIGVCFDGTGYGDDGTIWGSEFMVCDYNSYRRIRHLDYISLPGGDAAIREPWRIALACLKITGHIDAGRWISTCLKGIPGEKIKTVEKMIEKGINSPPSCGAGRWFDAVAALTGICTISGYEGEAPMLLESIYNPGAGGGYDFSAGLPGLIDQVMHDMRKNDPPLVSTRFHNGMASFIMETVAGISGSTSCKTVVLSGGVFQNSRLTGRVIRLLGDENFQVYTGRAIPVNDGGLALGQLAVASKTNKLCV
jgi:hydrogenase maturation protein HypF